MKRHFWIFAVMISALAMMSQTADAGGRHKMDRQLKVVAVATGAAATATFFALNNWQWDSNWNAATTTQGLTVAGAYALTGVGCAAITPVVGTVVVRRPLTAREANLLTVGCFVPIVGPMVLNAVYDANPQWFAAAPAPRARHVRHKRR